MVVADAILADGLQKEGAHHVGAQERLRVGDGVVVVGLGGVVHDGVAGRCDPAAPRVTDVAHDGAPRGRRGSPGDVLGVAGVGRLSRTVTCTRGGC